MPASHKQSDNIFQLSQQYIPGGVNSPVRAFKAVGGSPLVIARGKGSHLWDIDGNEYLDYVASWGPLMLGHAPAAIVEEVSAAAELGTSFGTPTIAEYEFAKLLCEAVPCMEKVRLVNSGTEAVMSAIRLARADTGRDFIIKFAGGYHGHSDGLLAQAGSGIATQGIPGSPGVPADYAALTITIPFNDLPTLRKVLYEKGDKVACLIGEPLPANMGVVPPMDDYWPEVRNLLDQYGILLIFDEVITGFRLSWQGGQGYYGVTPDICTLGKVIGGGLPLAAYGGSARLMQQIAPEGPVYQAGTLSGNPIAVAAGLAMLRTLQAENPYGRLAALTTKLVAGLRAQAADAGVAVTINHQESLFTLFFSDSPVTDYASAARADSKKYACFFHNCLDSGILFAPSQFEAAFVSCAHSEEDIAKTIEKSATAFREAGKI